MGSDFRGDNQWKVQNGSLNFRGDAFSSSIFPLYPILALNLQKVCISNKYGSTYLDNHFQYYALFVFTNGKIIYHFLYRSLQYPTSGFFQLCFEWQRQQLSCVFIRFFCSHILAPIQTGTPFVKLPLLSSISLSFTSK